MKRFLAASALLAFATALPAHAANLTLTDGRTFHNATIVSQTPRNIVIKHANGLSGVSKTLLPAELSSRYPIDEVAALEADRKTAEALARAHEFHKAEAERSFRLRLEREQSSLHNAQIAALEASQRLADAEAAQLASQRSENNYEYASAYPSYFSPYYRHAFGPSYAYASNCTPRWNEKSPRNHFVRDECAPSNDFNSHSRRPSPTQKVINSQTRRSHKEFDVPRISQTQPADEERKPTRVAAAISRR